MTGCGNRKISSTAGEAIFHLKLVSRIALLTTVVAILVLSTVVFFLSNESGITYAEVFRSRWLTQIHLDKALLIAGLILLGFVAFITWLISLYSSFRIAGPLYRFAQNMSITDKGISPIGIRHDDCLQDISQQLLASIKKIDEHKQGLADLCEQARDSLQTADAVEYASLIARIKEKIDLVQLDE